MSSKAEKKLVIPVDDSANPVIAMKHLSALFKDDKQMKFVLLHIVPALPDFFVEDAARDRDTAAELARLEEKNRKAAKELLLGAKQRLVEMGVPKVTVETVCRDKKTGIARDICEFAQSARAHGICLGSPARTWVTTFFFGEISAKLQDFCREQPLWLVKKSSGEGKILIAVDNSENALRAVRHAARMLCPDDCAITLLHVRRDMSRFVKPEVAAQYPGLSKLWHKSSQRPVAPFMEKAEKILLKEGFPRERIRIITVEAEKGIADEIIRRAESMSAATLFIGRRGYSNVKEYAMGSVARKIVDRLPRGAVCLVP